MTEVMAGRIDFFFVALGAALPQYPGGKLTALAVNGAARSAVLPDVPTLGKQVSTMRTIRHGSDFSCRPSTPRDIVDKLHRETIKAVFRNPR